MATNWLNTTKLVLYNTFLAPSLQDSPLPPEDHDECRGLEITEQNRFIFGKHQVSFSVATIILICLCFGSTIFWFQYNRHKVVFHTRSPLITCIGLGFLLIDNIINTILYSGLGLDNLRV